MEIMTITKTNDIKTLQALRNKVSRVDYKILELIKERESYALELVKKKKILKQEVVQRNIEEKVINRNLANGRKLGLDLLFVKKISKLLIEGSTAKQQRWLTDKLGK